MTATGAPRSRRPGARLGAAAVITPFWPFWRARAIFARARAIRLVRRARAGGCGGLRTEADDHRKVHLDHPAQQVRALRVGQARADLCVPRPVAVDVGIGERGALALLHRQEPV